MIVHVDYASHTFIILDIYRLMISIHSYRCLVIFNTTQVVHGYRGIGYGEVCGVVQPRFEVIN